MGSKIITGLSGGVDSSVATLLLQQQGHDVTPVFMKNWEEDDTDTYCSADEDIADAQAVCDALNLSLQKVNFAAEYWDHVFEYFLQEYKAGRTPNPDILCNKEVKFKAFLQYAQMLGADSIATGHYAQKRYVDGQYQLLKGVDPNKDQSYFLYTLGQSQLAYATFPLGHLYKSQVRQIAKENQLPTHAKKDSTGICFIGERKFKTFLNTYLPAQPGDIHDEHGNCIGRHDGLMFYTIGQRQGLGIGGVKNRPDEPWFVADKDLTNNRLIVVQGHDHPYLFNQSLCANQLHWVAGSPPANTFECHAKIRYRQPDQPCSVYIDAEGHAHVTFQTPQRAITLGQSVVFYQNDVCLGGGGIEHKA